MGLTGRLGRAWVGAWVVDGMGGFGNNVVLFYLDVGVGVRRIGELGPGHWGDLI